MDKLREEFEKWFSPRERTMKSQGLGLISISRLKNRQWEAWRDSRASIVVEPTHFILKNETTGPWGCDEDLRCYTLKLDASKAKDDFGGEIIPVIELRSIGLSIKGE
ncbi:TPA: hypothetical protein KUM74_002146 [Serratia marcescens]|nr:hypothetical protein [Serratia marcescens]HEJ6924032.1 hypothetical protein [Serratia marcescens]